jgi:Holliday junction resolvase|tara:strand:+ start:623 stop:955 length:333 start_codon:yes stop_codon:yes gene_type:complete
MGGKAARVKGASFEREIVNWHKERGVDAERIPLSGAMKGNYASDIKIGPQLALTAECKRRARGWQDIYDAFDQDNSDVVFIRKDRKPALVVLTMETYETFLEWFDWIKEK